MKPFPFRNMEVNQRIYNYRLSRARRVVENVFGICAARFRLLRRPIDVCPENVTTMVVAICTLHNFLMTENRPVFKDFDHDNDGIVTPGNWRHTGFNWDSIRSQVGGRNDNAIEIRSRFMEYFSSPLGAVSWQNNAINSNQS